MTYYAASYGTQFSEAMGTAVAVCTCQIVGSCGIHRKLEEAVEAAAQAEQEYWDEEADGRPGYQIEGGQAFPYSAKDLFTAAELREHRRALMNGEVVWLARG